MQVIEESDIKIELLFDFEDFLGLFCDDLEIQEVHWQRDHYISHQFTEPYTWWACILWVFTVVEIEHLEYDQVGHN
jgi:hypothetical protein